MHYEEFDKGRPQGIERENIIINQLKKMPMTIKAISKSLNLEYHCVQSTLLRLQKKGIVTKRRDDVFTYYGLIQEYRDT